MKPFDLFISTFDVGRSMFDVRILPLLFTFSISSQPAGAQLDTNINSMCDIWERYYNNGQLFPPGFLPGNDEDGDGQSNLAESIAGTDPLRFDPPHGYFTQEVRHVPAVWFTDPEEEEPTLLSPEAFEIEWHALHGKIYTLLCSPDLGAESWIHVDGPIYGWNDSITIGDLLWDADGILPDRFFWKVEVDDIDSDGDSLTNYSEHLLKLDPYTLQTHPGIPDLWLATHYASEILSAGQFYIFDANGDSDGDGVSNVEELISGGDPHTADAPQFQNWFMLHGTGEQNQRLTRSRQLTLPAGQTTLVLVAISSDEYDHWTSPANVDNYNDILEWKIQPSTGSPIEGQIDVNSRHFEWVLAEQLGETLTGHAGPVHYEEIGTLTAPPDADLTISLELAATNIGDSDLPSHIAVGIFPVEILLNETATPDDDLVPVSLGVDEDLATDFSVKIAGMDDLTAILSLKDADGDIKFRDENLPLENGVPSKTKLWGIAPSSGKNKTIIEVEIWRDTKELGKIEKEATVFKGVKIEFDGTFLSNVDSRFEGWRPANGTFAQQGQPPHIFADHPDLIAQDVNDYSSAIWFQPGEQNFVKRSWAPDPDVSIKKVMAKTPSFEITNDPLIGAKIHTSSGRFEYAAMPNERVLDFKMIVKSGNSEFFGAEIDNDHATAHTAEASNDPLFNNDNDVKNHIDQIPDSPQTTLIKNYYKMHSSAFMLFSSHKANWNNSNLIAEFKNNSKDSIATKGLLGAQEISQDGSSEINLMFEKYNIWFLSGKVSDGMIESN